MYRQGRGKIPMYVFSSRELAVKFCVLAELTGVAGTQLLFGDAEWLTEGSSWPVGWLAIDPMSVEQSVNGCI